MIQAFGRYLLVTSLLGALHLGCAGEGAAADQTANTGGDTVEQASRHTDADGGPGNTEDMGSQRASGGVDVSEAALTDAGAEEPLELAAIEGRFVNSAGEGIAELRVLCCTKAICYDTETDANGQFDLDDMDPEPIKIQVADPSQTYVWLYL